MWKSLSGKSVTKESEGGGESIVRESRLGLDLGNEEGDNSGEETGGIGESSISKVEHRRGYGGSSAASILAQQDSLVKQVRKRRRPVKKQGSSKRRSTRKKAKSKRTPKRKPKKSVKKTKRSRKPQHRQSHRKTPFLKNAIF